MAEAKNKFGVLCQEINEKAEQLFREFWENCPPELRELRDEVFSTKEYADRKKIPGIIWGNKISKPFAEQLWAINCDTYNIDRREHSPFAPTVASTPGACINVFRIPFFGHIPFSERTGEPNKTEIEALYLRLKPLAAYVENYFVWELLTNHDYPFATSKIYVYLMFS